MWCLFSIISHGMTAVCYPWLFAAICRGAASMMTIYGVRLVRQGDTAAFSQRFAGELRQWWNAYEVEQGRGNLAYAAAVCRRAASMVECA